MMMRALRKRFPQAVAILLSATVFMMSSAAMHHAGNAQEAEGTPAARNLTTVDESGEHVSCGQVGEAKDGVLVGYIVPCIVKTIENVTQRMTQQTMDWLKPTIYSFMTLVVVLFGVRILQGGGQVHTEGLLLLIKIGAVIAMMYMIPNVFVPMLYNVMNQSQEIVAGTIGPDTSSIYCDMSEYDNGDNARVWSHMDCLLGKLYGITVGSDGANGEQRPNMLLGASLFGMLAGFLFGGTFGVILFFAMVGVLWTMFMVVLRTVSAFLNGYLYASLLFIVSPLFMPLILMKASTQYFEPWWKGILGGILLPIIISSYAMFAMLLYDRMLFDDGSESGKPALLYKLMDNDIMRQLQQIPRPVCDMQRPNNPAQREEATGLTEEALARHPMLRNFVNPLLTAANNQCLGITRPSVEMTKALEVESNREAFNQLFKDSLTLLAIAMLINMGYSNILHVARRIVGSGGVASSLDARGTVENKLAAMQGGVRQSIANSFRNEDGSMRGGGTEFIEDLANVPRNIGAGIISGLRREP